MKTAMYELMDKIELQIEEEKIEGKFGIGIWGLHQAKNLVMDMLEKEKEQIIDAYNQGTLDGESSMLQYPNYYNQTYNTKQHIIDIMKADEDDGLYNQNK